MITESATGAMVVGVPIIEPSDPNIRPAGRGYAGSTLHVSIAPELANKYGFIGSINNVWYTVILPPP